MKNYFALKLPGYEPRELNEAGGRSARETLRDVGGRLLCGRAERAAVEHVMEPVVEGYRWRVLERTSVGTERPAEVWEEIDQFTAFRDAVRAACRRAREMESRLGSKVVRR